MVDSSNMKDSYFRNWLRNRLFADLKESNPSVIRDICRTADILREEDEYLELIVTKTLMRLISRKTVNRIELFISPLEHIEKPVLRRILRRAIEATEGLRGMNFVHIEDIVRLIKKGKAGDRVHLPRGVRAVKEYSVLKIGSERSIKIGEYEMQPPCEVNIGEIGVTLKAIIEHKAEGTADGRRSCLLDADAIIFPLKVRSRAEGDFFCPVGFGKRKKLQNYFVDEKVPRDERDRIPIVLSGNDIIWVAGYRADHRFRVTDRTGKILKLIMTKA
jgi:tRNA(Ile)-lysidine synthase